MLLAVRVVKHVYPVQLTVCHAKQTTLYQQEHALLYVQSIAVDAQLLCRMLHALDVFLDTMLNII